MVEKWIQGEIFPSINAVDKEITRKLLEGYTKKKSQVEALAKKETLTPQQRKIYEVDKELVENITMAMNLIQDDEVKKVIINRFLKERKYKNTIVHFRSIMSERTIDRRIDEGIEAIADSLKLWGII